MEQRDSIVESRSFDHVPETERHGTIRSQVQFWFMVNATLITLFTGAVGPAMGLGLTWTLLAVIVGSIFGTLFQAFHGAQGPHMGLPQMIQSRVQFGSKGAVLPLAAVTIVQLGFAIFFIQTASSSLAAITVDQTAVFDIVIGASAVVLAIVGYSLLLRVEKVASYITLVNLVLLTVAAAAVLPIGALLGSSAFVPIAFLAQFGASAIYQIAIAPMVSDYTRYLPFRTSGRAVSAAVFGGTLLSAVWLEALGAALALADPQGADLISGIRDMGDRFGFGLGTVSMAVAVMSCLITCSLSFYSGSVSLLSAFEAFRPLKSTGAVRAIALAAAGIVVITATLSLPADFLPVFSAFLSILGYFLIPWTAVNLTDYYLVRRGVYSITDIMKSDGGIYGRWGVPGMISYAIGFIAMIPFLSTAIYTGPIATSLGGADISFVVGLAVASGSYLLIMRGRDFSAEFEAVRAAPLNTLGHPQASTPAPAEPMEGNIPA
ncbi:purine-cytosine permease family protein [Arthrobacter sp. NPDC056727]|uniref:purine-cytosine permease family protein n=1 Tax=Arthrobacter sp. NPDC056727 TaxID=3345927 RepID=UPI00367151C4